MLSQVFSYCLSILLLLTHVGIPVFTHECHSMGKAWSSIYIPARSCCSGMKGDAAAQMCHAKKEEHTAYNKIPCCENHHGLIQLNSEFLHYKQVLNEAGTYTVPGLAFSNPVSLDIYPEPVLSVHPHGPMITLHGRSLLISKQVFLC